MSDPIRLVPKPERDAAEDSVEHTKAKACMLRHLDHYRKMVEADEIDQLVICATTPHGGSLTSCSTRDNKLGAAIGAVHTLLHRMTEAYLAED